MRALFLAYLTVFAIQVTEAAPALTVMARSGASGLNTIDPNISINNEGIIAFTGTDATGSRVFVVSSPGKPQAIVNAVSGRTYAGVGITSGADPAVVYRDLLNGPAYLLRKTSVSGKTELLGSSVASSAPADWDSITSTSIDVSSNGRAVVSGLVGGSTATALFIGTERPLTQSGVYTGVVGLRPQMSDIGEAVFRDNIGRIVTNNASGPVRVVAGAANGFAADTGNRPGISADGTAIAFSGNRNSSGAGIYASISPTGWPTVLVPVAGGSLIESNGDVFTGFTSEQRVGIRATHLPRQGGGYNDVFTVVFQGTKNGVPGVFTREITVANGILQPLGPVETLIMVGDALEGSTVTGFTLYRPINDRGTIAFTAALSNGRVAILSSGTPVTFSRLTDIEQVANPAASADTPLQPKPDPSVLRASAPFYGGLVADGVTPLIVKLAGATPASPITISFDAPQGGTLQNRTLSQRVHMLSDANWIQSSTATVPASGEYYAYIEGIDPTELTFSAGSTELTVTVNLSSGGTTLSNTFKIRKPPIILVHGYNADLTTWSSAFLEELKAARGEDFVVPITYAPKSENTPGRLDSMVARLNDCLAGLDDPEGLSNSLRDKWAFTRYDIVGHSQGGVLSRMLCASNPFPGVKPFKSAENFNRGRFRRIVTIGSPHNGSTLPYYIDQLPGVIYGALPASMKLMDVLQPKFNPFGDQIRQINSPFRAIDRDARFHLITATVEGGTVNPGKVPLCYFLSGLTQPALVPTVAKPLRGNVVLPRGSDGVVDLDSQEGGNGSKTSHLGFDTSHSPPELVFGVGPDQTETRDSAVAARVVTLLDGSPDNFGPFELPALLGDDRQYDIDDEVPRGILSDVITALVSPGAQERRMSTMATMASVATTASYNYVVTPPAAEPILGEVGWHAEVYGPNGVTTEGVTVTVDAADSKKVTVSVDSTVTGDVVLFVTYGSQSGKMVVGKPVVVTSRAAGNVMTGIEVRPASAVLQVKDRAQLEIWRVYDNGVKSQLFSADPSANLFHSGSSSIATVGANSGVVEAAGSGSTSISASFGGFSAQANITVPAPLPLTVAFGSATYVIGDLGGTVAIQINRTGGSEGAFTVNFSTGGGSAVAGTDYVGQTNTPVMFASGEMSKTVKVSVLNVPGYQGNRTFGAAISAASGEAQIGSPSATSVTIQECTPNPEGSGAFSDADWISMGGLPGADSQGFVYATAVDGSGNLYVGGSFRVIGNVVANGIAKWDGHSWSALGSGMNDSQDPYDYDDDAYVYALAVVGGDLYAAGRFTTAGGVPVNNIAKWNGSTWSALGSGTSDVVRALAVIGNDLYAGGYFTNAGGNTVNKIARWNGNAWSALGSGMSGSNPTVVHALAVNGNDLYAAGEFATAGGTPVNNIAKWNGDAWSALETGMDTRVYALAVNGGDLYAGGDFTTAGAVIAKRVARWNGSTWSPLGDGLGTSNGVHALAVSGNELYAGGDFFVYDPGGNSLKRIAKWDGSKWSALGSGMTRQVEALALVGDDLYAGGWFTTAGGVTAPYIAKWNGSAWSALGFGMSSPVNALAVSGSDLYVSLGDVLITAGGNTIKGIAKWSGGAWSALGGGIDVYATALAASGGDLYAAGSITTAGGNTIKGIAKWNGSAWSVLGSGMNGTVNALAVSGSDIYAGGEFTTAGGITVNRIAKWNGSAWSALGTGMNNYVHALAVSGSDLYAGGSFTTAGGTTVNRIAKWNGSAWSALASGMNDQVHALAVSGGNLYAGGFFTTAGGAFANQIAKWNGSAWSALGSGMGGGDGFPIVVALAVNGNDVYAGGRFTTSGGVVTNNIAKWNGSTWSALGSGVNDQVHALALNGNDLYVGGYFTVAGTAVAGQIARADLDGAHEIDIQQPLGTSFASGSIKDFGTVNKGSIADVSFTVANLRAGVLNLTGLPDKVVVSGPDAGDFNVLAQPASSVAAGGTTTFVVRFAPTSGGIKKATLSIANNDTDEGNYTINVIGIGFDPTLPDTTITSAPTTPTNSTGVTITFTGSDDTTAIGQLVYEGRLDDGAFALVTSPVALSGLAEGVHTYEVRAKDESGNVDPIPARVTWVVDRTSPETTITTAPSEKVSSSEAVFEFKSSEAVGTFTYALDGGAPVNGTGSVTFTGLAHGSHTFSVAATDVAGNVDPTPATVTWVVRPRAPEHTALAIKGSLLPQAGADARIQTGATWGLFGDPAISDSGDVAYLAKWKAPAIKGATPLPAQNGTGIFINDALLVKVGESVPGAGANGIPANAAFKSFKDPVMDQGGRVAFLAMIGGTGVSVGNDGVVMSNGRSGTLEVIAREGDIAPGTGGAVFKSFTNVSIQGEDIGGTLFVATLAGAPGGAPVNGKNNGGVWWLAAGEDSVTKVARKGDAGFATGETIQSIQVLQAISGITGHGRGQISGASALLQLGLVGGLKPRQVQVLGEPGQLTEIAGTGDSLGGALLPDGVWDKMSLPSADSQASDIVVQGTLQIGIAGVAKANAKGIFHSADAGATWEPLVRLGGNADALAQDAIFSALGEPVHSSSGAGVAFIASVKGGNEVTGANNDAIWRKSGAVLEPLVREGGTPPQPSSGAQWKSFTALAYPGNGGPLFVAMLKPALPTGPERITAKNDLGLYAVDAFGEVQELMRENQPLLGKTVKTFSVLKAIAGSAGSARSYNANSQVAALVTFTDGTTAIVKIEIP
ncbi:DUF7453 family protein [Verrucomicrobiota bacterium sgz303538]